MQLPFELIHTIVEQLDDSLPTLRACTLVCKTWHPIALRVLFYDFTLHTDRPGLHADLAFPHYVSRLNIYGSKHSHYQPAFFEDILRLFDRTNIIEIRDSAQFVLLLPRVFPHLRDLNLFMDSFLGVISLHELVASFPDLERLYVVGNGDEVQANRTDDEPQNLLPPPHLRTLLYPYPNSHRGSFLRWLSAHAPALEHVALYYLQENELPSADTLLRALGSHLRTLGIGLLDCPTHAQVAHLSLCTNTNLRALCVSHDYIASSLDLALPLTLLDTDAPALRHVTLGVNFTDVVNWIGYGEWGVLDSLVALRAPMLECLHICAFEQYGYMPQHAPDPSEMQRIVAARMPHCVQTGIFAGVSWEPTTWPLIHE